MSEKLYSIGTYDWERSRYSRQRGLIDEIFITKEFQLFPNSWSYNEYGYPEGHELHKGFAVEWLWFNFSFKRYHK
jgi:hypothetical protein